PSLKSLPFAEVASYMNTDDTDLTDFHRFIFSKSASSLKSLKSLKLLSRERWWSRLVSTGLDFARPPPLDHHRSTTTARPPPLDHHRSTTINQTLSRLWHNHH
ncbi:MAG: hypothetical protein V1775_08805, partial [Bacteroidota bacterium]